MHRVAAGHGVPHRQNAAGAGEEDRLVRRTRRQGACREQDGVERLGPDEDGAAGQARGEGGGEGGPDLLSRKKK